MQTTFTAIPNTVYLHHRAHIPKAKYVIRPYTNRISKTASKQAIGRSNRHLTIGLSDTLNLILLLNRVRVGRSTGGINNLLSEDLCHGLEVAEASLASTSSNEIQGVVHTTERRHIDGLATYNSSSSDTGAVFPGPRVDDGIDQDLDGVLIGGKVDDFKAVHNNAHGHELLSIVAALAHKAAYKALYNGTAGLAETLLLVSASGVWEEDGVCSFARNVILSFNVNGSL